MGQLNHQLHLAGFWSIRQLSHQGIHSQAYDLDLIRSQPEDGRKFARTREDPRGMLQKTERTPQAQAERWDEGVLSAWEKNGVTLLQLIQYGREHRD